MILLVNYTLMYASVLILVALGGCFSEHSGVINLGLEGIMVIGAMGGALTMKYFTGVNTILLIILTIGISGAIGMVYSLLLAVAAIRFNADQTIVGTALNMLGIAAATITVKAINLSVDPENVSSKIQYIDAKRQFLFKAGPFELNIFMVLTLVILILSYIILYKTRFGLRLMACGEHPQAAASVGIDVYKMRYCGVIISGALGGIGGIVYITSGVSEWMFENGVAGFGFLALAVMIFGQWKPLRIAAVALIFGCFRALSNVYSGIPFIKDLEIDSTVYNMMPYIISLLILALTSKMSRAPKAEGLPYDKGQR